MLGCLAFALLLASALAPSSAYAQCDEAPQFDCRRAEKSNLSWKQQTGGTKDKLVWKWGKGPATLHSEFANPTSTASYSLCIYSTDHSTLIGDLTVPPDATKWTEKIDKGQVKLKGAPEDPSAAFPVLRTPPPLPAMTATEAGVPDFVGSAATPNPIAPFVIPPHPLLNNGGDSRIHNDHYNTATYNRDGPLGVNPRVQTAMIAAPDDLAHVCAMLTFDEDGYIIAICIQATLSPIGASTRMLLLDPDTLDV